MVFSASSFSTLAVPFGHSDPSGQAHISAENVSHGAVARTAVVGLIVVRGHGRRSSSNQTTSVAHLARLAGGVADLSLIGHRQKTVVETDSFNLEENLVQKIVLTKPAKTDDNIKNLMNERKAL
uniref:Uncharacterized protein n=1 Tax=Romanomermis culicivorax TaxID=13658 RepID=A0A915LC79_ROMCU